MDFCSASCFLSLSFDADVSHGMPIAQVREEIQAQQQVT